MALVVNDWVREQSSSSGTGDLVLAGARSPGVAFSSVCVNGDTFEYSISNSTQFETGQGTYNSGANSITRNTVFRSSNSNALVNFSGTPLNIDITLPSKRLLSPAGNQGTDNTGGATITLGDGDVFNLITSTTAITAFTITNDRIGRRILLRFATARTLTHNGTSLILPTSANITTAAGDIAELVSLGSGNVRIVYYYRADGTPLTLASQSAGTGFGRARGAGSGAPTSLTGAQVGGIIRFGNQVGDATTTGSVATLTVAETTNLLTFNNVSPVIHGINIPGEIGQRLTIQHIGSGSTTLVHESATAGAAGERLRLGPYAANTQAVIIRQGESVDLTYDNRWLMVGSANVAASDTLVGRVELATTTETITGTDATRAVTPDSLAAMWEQGTDNTGGATITLGEGGFFNLITSTTAITAFAFTTDKAGRVAQVRFQTVRTLTHNATSLILPTAANITTAVGDTAVLISLGSGNFIVTDYQRADGTTLVVNQTQIASQDSTWSGVNTFTNAFILGTQQVLLSPSFPLAATLNDNANRLRLNSTATGDIQTITPSSGTTTSGRIVIFYINGVGTKTIKHAFSGGGVGRLNCPGGVDLSVGNGDMVMLIGAGSSGWDVAPLTGAVITATDTAAGPVELATTTETLTGTDATRAVTPDSLAAYWEKGTDNTGGATITLGEGGFFDLITSTTAITAFVFTTDKAGRTAQVRFQTARTLTHNATSLILPTGANITTAAGDIATVVSLGSGNFVVSNYQRASGAPLTAAPSQAEATITGRAIGAGTGAIGALTRLQSGEIIRQGKAQIVPLTAGTTNNDIAIQDGVTIVYVGVTGSTDCNITGFQYNGGTDHTGARIRVVNNTGTGRIVFKHNTGSSAANRIFTPAGGDWFSTYLNETVTLYKDDNSGGAWRIEGTFIQPTDLATTTQVLTGTDTALAVTSDALAALWESGADNSGGATITLGEGGSFNLITSTTAITAFAFTTDKAGRTAIIRFNTVRTLTHNATSLILPTAANITTAVGDICQIQSLGSGNFRVNFYERANGGDLALTTTAEYLTGTDTVKSVTADAAAALWEKGADNTGGATITLGDGGSFNLITSTTAITAFAFTNDKAGRQATIQFSTVRTLTHNSTSLILPGGANITTAVGDIAQIESLGSGNFRVNHYDRANGQPAVPQALVTQTSSLTQTNSTTNMTAGSYTIAANTLEVGSEYVFEGIFQAGRGATTTACNVVIEILLAGSVVATTSTAIITTASQNRSGQCRGTLTIRTLGASGTCMVSLQTMSDAPNAAGTITYAYAPAPTTSAPSTTTIDTTVSRSIEIRFRMSAAVATAYTHVVHSTITKLR